MKGRRFSFMLFTRTLPVLATLALAHCPIPQDGLTESQAIFLLNHIGEQQALARCQNPGAVHPSDGPPGCVDNVVTQGMILNPATGQLITTPSITGVIPLECRSHGYANYPISAIQKVWYVSDLQNPPAGATIRKVYVQSGNYDASGNFVGVNPFSQYSVGMSIYCLMGDPMTFQKLDIN